MGNYTYARLTNLAGFFAITGVKIIVAKFSKMEKMRIDKLDIYVVKKCLPQRIAQQLNLRNQKKKR